MARKKKVHERVVCIFDTHFDPFEPEHPSWTVTKKFIKSYKPDRLVWGGDILEMASITAWNKQKPALTEGRRYQDDIDHGKAEIVKVVRSSPKTKHDFILGNHCYRVERYVEENPAMKKKMDVVDDLGLLEMGFNVIPYNGMLKLGKLTVIHGKYTILHHAKKHLEVFGGSVLYGHVHRHQSYSSTPWIEGKSISATSIPCLNSCNPEWLRGDPNAWQNGLAIVDLHEDGNFTIHPIIIIDGRLSYGGSFWNA